MEVNLTKRIDAAEGRQYCPAIVAANGRVKRSWVLVSDKPEKHKSGIYYGIARKLETQASLSVPIRVSHTSANSEKWLNCERSPKV